MPISNPTFVLIPGAWHSPSHFSELNSRLHQARYPTFSLPLPSLNPAKPQSADLVTDVTFIREKLLLPLLDQGEDVVLVMHSYGGVPGSAAAKGLSKMERGLDSHLGGIIGLVYLAAVVTSEGQSLIDKMGGQVDHSVVVDLETHLSTITDPTPAFYADVPSTLTLTSIAALLPHSVIPFGSPSPPSAWSDAAYEGCRAYVRCLRDASITQELQDKMLGESGVRWTMRDIDTGHSPFLSRPDELARYLVELAEGFRKALT